jgi:preprotein translocase SecE subunit
MADKPTSGGKTKRRVKNPETFREKALKATEDSQKPAKAAKLKAGGAKAVSPIKQSARKMSETKALKPLHKPARIFGKIIVPPYLRSSWAELKLVTWPNWTQSRKLTTAVLIFAIIFGATIAGVDWILNKIFKELLLS